MDKNTKRRDTITAAVLCALVAVFIFFCVKEQRRTDRVAEQYDSAVELILSGSYTEGRGMLEAIADEDYKDTEDFILYCKLVEHRNGLLHYHDSRVEFAEFSTCSMEQRLALRAEIEELSQWFDEYYAQLSRESEARARQRAAELAKKCSTPYVGMEEKYIGLTELGAPSPDTRSNVEIIGGERYYATIYDFFKNGRVIFSARCIDGVVTEVWDKRNDKPYTSNYTWSDDDADPYNAGDYRSEEDFYDDHYYDFHDYYQAERYWREHRDD